MTKVLVLDFDGVIVDSEPIKQAGFGRIFTEFGEAIPTQVEEVKNEFSDGRGNRTDIIRKILERQGATDVEAKTAEYVKRYGDVVDTDVRSLGVTPEIRSALEKFAQQVPVYMCSTTPEAPLRNTVESLGITPYFKKVLGSPKSKVANLTDIASAEKVEPHGILFVGDSEGDRKAAEEFGCRFIGIRTSLNGWRERGSFKTEPSLAAISLS